MTTALLIIDVQKALLTDATKDIPSKVEILQDDYDIVFAFRCVNPPHSPWRELLNWHELDDGSTGTELAFDPASHAEVYTKGVYSCLSEAFLQRLTQLGVKEVHLCGMDTNCCVLKTAVDLFERGFRPVLLSKFCASHSGDAYHDMALKLLEKLIGPGQIV